MNLLYYKLAYGLAPLYRISCVYRMCCEIRSKGKGHVYKLTIEYRCE